MSQRPREATSKLLDMVEQGILEPVTVLKECLNYMSESDVSDMAESAGYFEEDLDEEDLDEEDMDLDLDLDLDEEEEELDMSLEAIRNRIYS